MIAGARGLGDGNLAVRVKEFVAAGRADENRRIISARKANVREQRTYYRRDA